jgi:hypothetical protein
MASDNSYLNGLPPKLVDIIEAQAEFNADKVLVVIDRPNITQVASDDWTYEVPFRLVGEISGKTIPYTGTIGAAVTQSTGSGQTPVVSSATPSLKLGSGSVTVGAGASSGWSAGEVATMTLTYTNLQGGTDTDTFTVTMS